MDPGGRTADYARYESSGCLCRIGGIPRSSHRGWELYSSSDLLQRGWMRERRGKRSTWVRVPRGKIHSRGNATQPQSAELLLLEYRRDFQLQRATSGSEETNDPWP